MSSISCGGLFLVEVLFPFWAFFLDCCFPASLLFCLSFFSAFLLFHASAFILLCFSDSPPFCFSAWLLFCFFASLLLHCFASPPFSAFLLLKPINPKMHNIYIYIYMLPCSVSVSLAPPPPCNMNFGEHVFTIHASPSMNSCTASSCFHTQCMAQAYWHSCDSLQQKLTSVRLRRVCHVLTV